MKKPFTLSNLRFTRFIPGILKILLGLLPLLFYHCSGEHKISVTGTLESKIIFKGKIDSPPKIFDRASYSYKIRFYNCPKEFGKINSDTGTFPFKANDCRKNFSESTFQSKPPEYSFETNQPKEWTHAFIQLLDTDVISGLYSPGENPFWFKNESMKTNILEHTFDFESTENPIPDAEQIKLAEKFSPLLIVKKGKTYLPSNLEKFSNSYSTITYTGKNPDSALYEIIDKNKDNYFSFDERLYGGDTHLYFHVRPASTFLSGTSENALPGWRDNRNYRYSKTKGDLVISYYIWFDYNEGPSRMGNLHEGDFESFAVLADSNGIPKRIMTTGHNHVMLDTSWKNINSIDNHPLIFIAHGNKGTDGGNPSSPYGGYETSLEAGNFLFNALANPKDIFPDISLAQIIIPKNLNREKLKNIRIGPGEWIDPTKTRYVSIEKSVSREIAKLIKWEEPAWIGKAAFSDPDKNHDVPESSLFFQNFPGRLGKNPRSSLDFFKLAQYGKSPVNPPFKMNEEQHFTFEKPKMERCEKARIGDYCPKFNGDEKTPQ